MSLNLDTFKTRMLATSGNTKRDENIKNSKHFLNSTFYDDASYNPYILFFNTETQLKCRLTDRKKSSSYGVTSVIQTLTDEDIKVGDILLDTSENEYWICLEVHTIGETVKQGVLGLSNYSLKFQNQDGTILSYPCITSNKTFSENPNQTVISLGENKKSILLPFDENTSGLKVDDRMFIDRLNMTPFKIIGSVDNVTYSYGDKGLIYFIAEQDILIATGEHPDRPDLGVCDYFEPTTSPTLPENKNYSIITHTGNPEIRIGGSTKTFTCTAYDELDNIVEITPVWTITTLPEYETYIHKTETGNTIKIKADDVANMIQSKIKLEVSDVSGDYYSSIYITIVSGV